jgi:toxin ParE1/3/4
MKAHPVVFSRRAQDDLANQLNYLVPIAGERTARRFIDRIVDHCGTFQTFPKRGISRDDIITGLRIVGYKRHASIAFIVTGDTVYILRVFMRGMNFGDPADFES